MTDEKTQKSAIAAWRNAHKSELVEASLGVAPFVFDMDDAQFNDVLVRAAPMLMLAKTEDAMTAAFNKTVKAIQREFEQESANGESANVAALEGYDEFKAEQEAAYAEFIHSLECLSEAPFVVYCRAGEPIIYKGVSWSVTVRRAAKNEQEVKFMARAITYAMDTIIALQSFDVKIVTGETKTPPQQQKAPQQPAKSNTTQRPDGESTTPDLPADAKGHKPGQTFSAPLTGLIRQPGKDGEGYIYHLFFSLANGKEAEYPTIVMQSQQVNLVDHALEQLEIGTEALKLGKRYPATGTIVRKYNNRKNKDGNYYNDLSDLIDFAVAVK